MSDLRLVALDLSLQSTGAAWTHDWRGTPALGVRTITSRHTGHQRLADILTEIATVCRSRPALVAIEALPIVSGTGNTALLLAELHGLVKQMLWGNNIPYVLVHNSRLKTYATGKGSGKGTDKDAVLLAAARRYGEHLTVANNNESDAAILLAMALHHYGEPLADVPATHAAALARVDWPVLNTVPPPGGTARRGLPSGGAAKTLQTERT